MVILNKTRKPSERYRIVKGGMGYYKDTKDSPNYDYHIVTGVDRGSGYQCTMSIECFFSEGKPPFLARVNAIEFLIAEGYESWLRQKGIT